MLSARKARSIARRFQIAIGTLRDWEQGVHVPDSAATAYLRVIAQDPDGVARALAASIPEPVASTRR